MNITFICCKDHFSKSLRIHIISTKACHLGKMSYISRIWGWERNIVRCKVNSLTQFLIILIISDISVWWCDYIFQYSSTFMNLLMLDNYLPILLHFWSTIIHWFWLYGKSAGAPEGIIVPVSHKGICWSSFTLRKKEYVVFLLTGVWWWHCFIASLWII